MPRITKIRIVGTKYDNFKKCHENTIFDLTKDGEPDHTLVTLNNGSGKGVLMQLISQILLPNTKWGKNDGNKITGMFLNRNNQFSPYTFHVLLEWKLDTLPERWLITGICVTGTKKDSLKDDEKEEEKIGTRYFMYTHEHYTHEFYTIENIPVYFKEDRRPANYEEVEKFLFENKKDFRRFSESSSKSTNSEYYQYLESHGIYRSEWSILKLINKVEGGVGDYFSKAKDNKGIFNEYIIPAISENINNQYEENKNVLKDMFKSNISITKNLPILINREKDYKSLIFMLQLLIQDADIGISYKNRKDNIIVEGNNLYSTLSSLQNNISNEINTWNKEIVGEEKKKWRLNFEKDNLEYAKQNIYMKEYETEKKEEEENSYSIKREIEELEEDRKKYKINKFIIPFERYKNKKSSAIKEINEIINSIDVEDIGKEISNIDDNIKERWEVTKLSWNRASKSYRNYESFLNIEKEEIERKINNLNENRDKINVNLLTIHNRKMEFNKKQKELGEEFDIFRIAFPQLLLEDLEKEKTLEEEKKDFLNKEKDEFEKNLMDLRVQNKEIDMEIERIEKDKKEIEDRYNNKKQKEEEVFLKVLELCHLNNEEETYSKSWLQNKMSLLNSEKEEKSNKLNTYQKELWENNIDLYLNKEEFWIPNNDINVLKEEIEALGVKVIYGNKFLYSLSKEEKEGYIEAYSLLPFSLIVPHLNDWEIIRNNISEDIFIRSMIPIYIRSEMEENLKMNYKLIKHKGLSFVLNNSIFQQWKNNLKSKEEDLKYAIEILTNSIEKIDEFKNKVYSILNDESSEELGKKLISIEENINKFHKSLGHIKISIEELEEKINLNKKDIENSFIKLEKLKDKINKIKNFIEFKSEIEEREKEEKELKDRLQVINIAITDTRNDKDNIDQKLNDKFKEYEKWKIEINYALKDIKEIIKEADFKEEVVSEFGNSMEPNFDNLDEDEIFKLISHRKILNQKIEEKNYKINIIKENIKELDKNIDDTLRELNRLDKNWENYKLENISKETLEIEIEFLEKRINDKRKIEKNIFGKIKNLEGMILNINKDMKEKEGKISAEHNRTPMLWEDLDLGEKEFNLKRDIEDNNGYLSRANEILKSLESRKFQMSSLIADIRPYEELDWTKGKTSQYLMDKIKDNEKKEVDFWINEFKSINRNIENHINKAQQNFDEFIEGIKSNIQDEILKYKIKELIGEKSNIRNFSSNKDSFNSMIEHAQREIKEVNNDKLLGESAKEQWAIRAARQVIKISECLKEMVNKMVYVNENGHAFKLVRLKGEENLPKDENEIKLLLDEYFIECIEKLQKLEVDFDNLDDKTLETYMGDKAIFSKALRGKYPTLEVYKMTEKNEFLYVRPLNYHYATWGAINAGEGNSPEGSGGQSLSINTFVIMMLMNYKKKTLGNDNPWTVLMLDNPFGKASGAHVLDPIFTIANKLNFQIISFAAPEIIKTEISERFPIFWALKINNEHEKGKLGSVVGKVVHGGRVRRQN